jgi:hypothetical protein
MSITLLINVMQDREFINHAYVPKLDIIYSYYGSYKGMSKNKFGFY